MAPPESSPTGPVTRTLEAVGASALRLPRPAWALVAGAWGGMIWLLSSQAGRDEPGTLLWSWLGNMAHAPLFGLLALWLALAGPRERGWARLAGRDRLIVLLLVLGWSALDELHQSQVPLRDASVLDLVTDLVGALATLDVARAVVDRSVSEPGLRLRLLRGVLACSLAALAATLGF